MWKTEEERDLFLNNFHKYLLQENPESSGHHSGFNIQKATRVCKNLGKFCFLYFYQISYLQKEVYWPSALYWILPLMHINLRFSFSICYIIDSKLFNRRGCSSSEVTENILFMEYFHFCAASCSIKSQMNSLGWLMIEIFARDLEGFELLIYIFLISGLFALTMSCMFIFCKLYWYSMQFDWLVV